MYKNIYKEFLFVRMMKEGRKRGRTAADGEPLYTRRTRQHQENSSLGAGI
jgi:hypothetical protein